MRVLRLGSAAWPGEGGWSPRTANATLVPSRGSRNQAYPTADSTADTFCGGEPVARLALKQGYFRQAIVSLAGQPSPGTEAQGASMDNTIPYG